MASRKMLARILHRGAKANSSPPRDDPYSDRHRPDPDFDGYCWCGRLWHSEMEIDND
jgi:hypothetical protein